MIRSNSTERAYAMSERERQNLLSMQFVVYGATQLQTSQGAHADTTVSIRDGQKSNGR